MANALLTFLYLAYPILLGLAILGLQFSIKQAEDVSKMQFSLGFVAFESTVRRLWIIRVILLCIAIGFFMYPAFRDYADLFPRHMQMEVFFDDEGISEALSQFSEADLGRIKIASEWPQKKAAYVASLNQVIAGVNHDFRFEAPRGAVRSKGENSIDVRKLQGWSWQRYRVESGRGNLVHTHEIPSASADAQKGASTISSTFELLETDRNYVDLSLMDIYVNWRKVLAPEYKQFFTLAPGKIHYNSNLTALSRVRFFPYVDIEETVYLVQIQNDYVPVGYALYHPD